MQRRRKAIPIAAAAILLPAAAIAILNITPPSTHAQRFERLSASHQPPGDNGWHHLTNAHTALNRHEALVFAAAVAEGETLDPGAFPDYFAMVGTPLGPAAVPALAERVLNTLHTSRVPLHLDNLAASPRIVWPASQEVNSPQDLLGALLPHQSTMRSLGRICTARAVYHANASDWPSAINAVEHTLAIARAARSQLTIVSQLTATSIHLYLIEYAINPWLSEGKLTRETLEALADAIDRQSHAPTLKVVYEGDAIIGSTIWADMPIWEAVRTRQDNLAAAFNQAFVELAAVPLADRNPDINHLATLTILTPPAQSVRDALGIMAALDADHARGNLTRTALAIELHRAQTGTLPATLADLTHPNAPAFTRDPMTANQPLRYTPDPTRPAGYLLYSIGTDLIDNHGTPPTNPRDASLPGDIVWPAFATRLPPEPEAEASKDTP